jgi:hypothetical protein
MTEHPEVGICGLSCRLCPRYSTGCRCRSREHKEVRWCPFIPCAEGKCVEFCWNCKENNSCARWRRKRAFGRDHDSFKCYQKLEDDIAFVRENGLCTFIEVLNRRGWLLDEMLKEFDEGKSRSFYCIAATVFGLQELEDAIKRSQEISSGLDVKVKSEALRSILEETAKRKNYLLKPRK